MLMLEFQVLSGQVSKKAGLPQSHREHRGGNPKIQTPSAHFQRCVELGERMMEH